MRDGEVVKDQQGDEGWGPPGPFIAFLSSRTNQRTINPTNITKYSIFTRSPSRPIALISIGSFFSPPISGTSAYNCKPLTTYAPFHTNLYLFQSPLSL